MRSDIPCFQTLILALALLASATPVPVDAAADPAAGSPPDVTTFENSYEQAFAAAINMPDDTEPLHILQAWGAVIMSAVVADRARAMQEFGDNAPPADGEETTEQVLARWQQMRPGAGGPDLFRTFSIRDPATKRTAIISLLDRFPDDALVVFQALQQWQLAGEAGRAVEAAETFLARNPDHSSAYRLLLQAAGTNETLQDDALRRWARYAPSEPTLVSRWLGTESLRRDTDATSRLLSAFFAADPANDGATLGVCQRLARRGFAAFRTPARTCVARIAGDPEATEDLVEQAAKSMAELAASDGDWSGLVAAIDRLAPAARVRALSAAAASLEAPARCGERLTLLRSAADTPPTGNDDDGTVAIARALRACAGQPPTEALFIALLERSPPSSVARLVHTWLAKVNDIYRGEMPASTADILETRLDTEPTSGLFEALDVVYQFRDPHARRLALLRRWHAMAPHSMPADAVADLAEKLIEDGTPGEAIALLEQRHAAPGFASVLAETLWLAYRETASEGRAARFAAELIAHGDIGRGRLGHTLNARAANLAGDLATAEASYWRALEGPYPSQDVAIELLSMIRWRGEQPDLSGLAERLCSETELKDPRTTISACAAELLARAGSSDSAAALIAAADDLPEDLQALGRLATAARTSGRLDLVERVLRRMLALDPVDRSPWINLGVTLEKAGRADQVEDLLEQSRRRFEPPPSLLYRAAGRALTKAHRPRRAIELLLECRATLTSSAGDDWNRSWIDHELQEAYRELGSQVLATGKTKQTGRTVEQLEAAAERSDAEAMHALAVTKLTPDAGEAACTDGQRLLEAAAHAGRASAAALLGKHLFYGLGTCVASRPMAARPWLEAAVDADQPGARYDLAMALLRTEGGDEARTRGLRLLDASASQDNALAVETLGFLYATGLHVTRDVPRAEGLFGAAARLGSDGFPRLILSAHRADLLRGLVEQGIASLESWVSTGPDETDPAETDPAAAALFAQLAANGLADNIDPGRWLALARQSAEAGDPRAMRVLRNAYRFGTGVTRDRGEARRWQRRCAEAGNAYCMMFEGNDLIEGKDGSRDLEAGIRLLRRAAATDHWWAIQSLGRRYDEGRLGLERDPGEAARWKKRLADLGDPSSIGWRLYHGYR